MVEDISRDIVRFLFLLI